MTDFFSTYKNNNDTWSWTLTTRLLSFLDELENLFGPRQTKPPFGGIEFADEGPCVWFAWEKYSVVRLSLPCMTEQNRALFQLAHEAVHLISPETSNEKLTVLEEGLACWYQLRFVRQNPELFGADWQALPGRRGAAQDLVAAILDENLDGIKYIRGQEPHISSITAEMLAQQFKAHTATLKTLASSWLDFADEA